jgi:hypothetical protein
MSDDAVPKQFGWFDEGTDEQVGWFNQQGNACRALGSPLWGAALEALGRDVEAHGVVESVMRQRPLRFGDAAPIRLVGLAHRLALSGHAPALAAMLPSCGGQAPADLAAVGAEVVALVGERADEFVAALDQPPQTNEVARAGGLVLGLLWAQRVFGHPLRLREVGCSGGLNLQMARFRYSHGGSAVGPADSPVGLNDLWDSDPRFVPLHVVDTAGCDPAPVDVSTDAGALWLRSFVWPDQTARFARLDGAISLARAFPSRLDRTPDTAAWLEQELEAPPALLTTVVFHSIVWQYIDKADRVLIASTIDAAGSRATAERPLVWLQFEPDMADRSQVAVTLRAWPGDVSVRLASADFHGRWVRLDDV